MGERLCISEGEKLVNRGYITGPLCTIYGVGAVSVFLILRPLQGNWIALYFGGVIVATVLEYITAVIMEGLFHTSWWDYSNKKFNFSGADLSGQLRSMGIVYPHDVCSPPAICRDDRGLVHHKRWEDRADYSDSSLRS